MAQTDYKALGVAGINLYTVDDNPTARLGQVVEAYSATYGCAKFIYLLGVASTAEGSFVTYDETYATALLAANAKSPVAVAVSAVVAGKYGWYCRNGKIAGLVAAAFADNGWTYATATAGTVDDAVVAGDRVKGSIGRSAIDTPTTGMAWIQIESPYVDDGVNDAAGT